MSFACTAEPEDSVHDFPFFLCFTDPSASVDHRVLQPSPVTCDPVRLQHHPHGDDPLLLAFLSRAFHSRRCCPDYQELTVAMSAMA